MFIYLLFHILYLFTFTLREVCLHSHSESGHRPPDHKVTNYVISKICDVTQSEFARVPPRAPEPLNTGTLGTRLTSARQFEWGYAIEDKLWWTPQFFKNCWVNAEVNSDPPSVSRSSGIPKVLKVRRRQSMRHFSPSRVLSTIGQLEYRSTITR